MILRQSNIILLLFLPLILAVSRPDPGPITHLPRQHGVDGGGTGGSGPKRPEYVAHPAGELVCRPFGECEPCPSDELDQPFCMPFGNRRLLHCQDPRKPDKGEVPAWEACGKVVRKEKQDFYEFVTCNLLFLIVALTILWARSSALATAQYRQLAARIGIPSGGWRA
ncbi:hypothetical protein EHS25_008638 [Saitozyma podzolica]|uniref:Uncharacterized protein n=1 Tax=Saitozyma podzolica TaxID=1890683 RepID=A0A427YMA9_9TREE|nr:hypothetical protein EHS25_008638 [Saitozyma podzolica]